jgi:hypothetical protein
MLIYAHFAYFHQIYFSKRYRCDFFFLLRTRIRVRFFFNFCVKYVGFAWKTFQ